MIWYDRVQVHPGDYLGKLSQEIVSGDYLGRSCREIMPGNHVGRSCREIMPGDHAGRSCREIIPGDWRPFERDVGGRFTRELFAGVFGGSFWRPLEARSPTVSRFEFVIYTKPPYSIKVRSDDYIPSIGYGPRTLTRPLPSPPSARACVPVFIRASPLLLRRSVQPTIVL